MDLTINKHFKVTVHSQIKEQVKFLIATGALTPGSKLWSVRRLEKELLVNRNTVFKAFSELTEEGLLERRSKSGFYVKNNPAILQNENSRKEIDNCIEILVKRAAKLGVPSLFLAKTIYQNIKDTANKKPFIAYTECTEGQLETHCRDLEKALDVNVKPLLLHEIRQDNFTLDPSISVLITSVFHYPEIKKMFSSQKKLKVLSVIIKPSSAVLKIITSDIKSPKVIIIEPDSIPNREFSKALINIFPSSWKIKTTPLSGIEKIDFKNHNAVLYASRDCDKISKFQQKHKKIFHEVVFSIEPESMEKIKKELWVTE